MHVSELLQMFPATPATIRRDLSKLEKEGKIIRSWGRVRVSDNETTILPIMQRVNIHSAEKNMIGKAAASLVENNQSIILDSGTTCVALAQQLVGINNLTIITNSLPIPYIFANKNNIEVRVSGGILLGAHMSLIGPDAEKYFEGIQVDICFIGASGVRSGSGFTTGSPFEGSIKRCMMKSAKKVVALVDASKFEISSIIEFARFEEINTLITTHPLSDKNSLRKLEERGVTIIFAN